ncbi:MAG: hypothetical protein IJ347_07930 [Faecalibacterium sp.]|nr:hypothetical protein [Faecalibacterium sp.]
MNSLLGMIVIIVVIVVGYLVKNKVEKHMLREQTGEVVIQAMEKQGEVCMIQYRRPDGKTITLRVPEGEYNRSKQGEPGVLTWIKDSFVEFESEDPLRKFRG